MTDQPRTGRKRHHLPAASVAYFSRDEDVDPMRRRTIAVAHKASNNVYRTAAERVGYLKDLYGYDKAQDFDSYFTASEPVYVIQNPLS
jgi:hypothetical protein